MKTLVQNKVFYYSAIALARKSAFVPIILATIPTRQRLKGQVMSAYTVGRITGKESEFKEDDSFIMDSKPA